MHNLAILDAAIRTDAEGRFCLNDCWKAAGKPEEKKPSNWNDLLGTRELIQEISQSADITFGGKQPISVRKGGNAPGIWACRELVYSYAAWISPAFHLTVIRAFDALVRGEIDHNPERARRMQIDTAFRQCLNIADLIAERVPGFDNNQRVLMAARGTYNTTGTNPLEQMGITSIAAPVNDRHYTPTQLGEFVELSGMKMNAKLAANGLQTRVGNTWKMTDKRRGFARIFDTTRKNGKGSQEQLKWLKGVLDVLA